MFNIAIDQIALFKPAALPSNSTVIGLQKKYLGFLHQSNP